MKWSCLLSVVLALLLCACATDPVVTNDTSAEKELVYGCVDWVYPSFADACENAHTIVIGEVTNVPEAWENEVVRPDGRVIAQEAYTDIELTVEETLKGEYREIVTYVQMGGETADTIYLIDTVKPLSEGQRVLIFLYEDGHMVPGYVLPIGDDASIPAAFFPEGYTPPSGTMYVDEYVELIETELKN